MTITVIIIAIYEFKWRGPPYASLSAALAINNYNKMKVQRKNTYPFLTKHETSLIIS